MTKTICSD